MLYIIIYSIYIFKLLSVAGVKNVHIPARVQYVYIVNIKKNLSSNKNFVI